MSNKVKDEGKEEKKKVTAETKKEAPKKPVIKTIEGVRGIVRFVETDVIGSKKVKSALLNVKGISHSFSAAVIACSGVDQNKMIGAITDEELKKIEDVARHPEKYGIPNYLINRRSDPVTGANTHALSSDLAFIKKSDIDSMKKMQAYKGVRHQLGLPCRGQRTRSSFRTGAKVGVVKHKQAPGAAAPAAPSPAAKPEKK